MIDDLQGSEICHLWGSEDVDWTMLYEAEQYITGMYRRITGRHPLTKEKYGTIRYEMLSLWIQNDKEMETFLKILLRATHKFPKVRGEILDDIIMEINPHESAFCAYCAGYFMGLVKCRSEELDVPAIEHTVTEDELDELLEELDMDKDEALTEEQIKQLFGFLEERDDDEDDDE